MVLSLAHRQAAFALVFAFPRGTETTSEGVEKVVASRYEVEVQNKEIKLK
jgi:hypothetical protein